MKIKWTGDVASQSGYGIASKNYCIGLRNAGADVKVDSPTNNFPEKWMLDSSYLPDEGRIHIMHSIPRMLCKAYYTVFEFDRAPESWGPVLEASDLVMTPSEYSKKSLATICPREKIKIVPHGIEPVYNPYGPKLEFNEKLPSFKFLSVFEWVERKCPEILIQAFCEEFDKSEDVCMIIKSYSNAKPISMFIKNLAGDANIYLLNKRLEELSSLYRSCDAYVLAQAGGAWEETVSEAMACGLPTITTRTGGVLEYANNSNSFLVEHEGWQMIRHNSLEPLVEPWFKIKPPKIESLKDMMRLVFEGGEEVDKKKDLAPEIACEFTWDKAAQTMIKHLGDTFGN